MKQKQNMEIKIMKFKHKLNAPKLTKSQFQKLHLSGQSIGDDVYSYKTETGITVNVFRFCGNFKMHAVGKEESDHELHAQSTDLARLNAHLAGFCDYHGKKEAITETYSGFVTMGATKA
jgi:hypothetical protein